MFRKFLTASTIACVMACGVPTGASALTGEPQLKKVGKVTKEAGKETVKGTKNVGKTVEGAVRTDVKSVRCRDGTVQTGKSNAEACRRHGGTKQ
jgi:hypothetical protein